MAEMPKRDTKSGSGCGCGNNCKCRDRVAESEKENQSQIDESGVDSVQSYPEAPGADDRNDPPGSQGGHV